MSELNAYLFAQQFAITTLQTIVVTDSAVTSSPVTLSTGTKYYRILAAKTASGAGTLANPHELLHRVEMLLNTARWRVRMQSSGRVRITYVGTGSATLDITDCLTVMFLLGFDSSLGGLTVNFAATNAYVEGANLPTHAIFAVACWPDSGWVRLPARVIGKELPTGVVSAWGDRIQGLARDLEITFAPHDWTWATANGAAGTPMFPTDTTRQIDPSASEPAQVGPWSILDQLGNQVTQRWGCVFGTLQDVIAGTDTAFEVCSVRLSSLRAEGSNKPTVSDYDRRWNQSLALRWIEGGTRT